MPYLETVSCRSDLTAKCVGALHEFTAKEQSALFHLHGSHSVNISSVCAYVCGASGCERVCVCGETWDINHLLSYKEQLYIIVKPQEDKTCPLLGILLQDQGLLLWLQLLI